MSSLKRISLKILEKRANILIYRNKLEIIKIIKNWFSELTLTVYPLEQYFKFDNEQVHVLSS
jgi:hypothetical protein